MPQYSILPVTAVPLRKPLLLAVVWCNSQLQMQMGFVLQNKQFFYFHILNENFFSIITFILSSKLVN